MSDLPSVVEALAAWDGPSAADGRARRRRRRHGTYYTPAPLVAWMLERTRSAGGLDRCCDPSCGAGAFLVAAARDGVALRQLHGFDCNPLAVLATRLALVQAGLPPESACRQVRLLDALRETPPTRGFDVVCGNPPWGLALPQRELGPLRRRMDRWPELLNGEVCSAALFVAVSLDLVRPGGTVCLVLPESWLSSRRGEALRRHLHQHCDVQSVDVLRKGVFADAPDMIPTILTLSARAPAPTALTVRRYGQTRRWDGAVPLSFAEQCSLPRSLWAGEPAAVLPVGLSPELVGLWQRLASHRRLHAVADLHDGAYKTRLLPLLGQAGPPVLLAAAELRRYVVRHAGAHVDEAAVSRLPKSERLSLGQPAVLVHAIRKSALADRVVAAADPNGAVLASNNFVRVRPRSDGGWSVHALCALLNSRLVNRWFAERYIQVNIEGFALGAIPLPAEPSTRLAALGRRAAAGEPVDEAVDDEVARLYGVSTSEREAIDRHWRQEPPAPARTSAEPPSAGDRQYV